MIILDSITSSFWGRLVDNSSFATFFQTPQCYQFYKDVPLLEAFVYGIENEGALKGVVVGYVEKNGGSLKQFFSRRAIVNGGPLLTEDITDEELIFFLSEVKKRLAKKAIYIETRNFNDYSRFKNAFVQAGFEYRQHLNFHIDSSSMDVVNANLGKSRKRDIRTSLRDGATVVSNPTLEQVKEYYAILKELYATKVKTPLFPFTFFETLWHLKEAKILLVQLNGKVIGGTVCVCLKGKTVYEWFACGEDGCYKNIYPSTLATFSGIEYAATNGYPLFDMMGAGRPDEGYGVRDFKSKFGGELVEFGRFLCVTKPLLYKIGTIGVKLLKNF